MESFSYPLWFAVRYVHVCSAALLLGGTVLSCALGGRSYATGDVSVLMALAPLYEWGFWSVTGVAVATGISNLGLKGDGLLGPETGWGESLSIKVAMVLAVLVASMVRTEIVVRSASAGNPAASRRIGLVLCVSYALTGALLLLTLWLGLGLAHGRY